MQHFKSSGLTLMADSQYSGQSRVQLLLDYIAEREIDLEDLGTIRRIKLEQCIQLCQFESDANQVRNKAFNYASFAGEEAWCTFQFMFVWFSLFFFVPLTAPMPLGTPHGQHFVPVALAGQRS